MKKALFFGTVFLYSLFLLGASSELYLVGGSNVIEFVYSMPLLGKLTVIGGLFVVGYGLFFSRFKGRATGVSFLLLVVLSVICSQSILYSGKNNQIKHYVLGVAVGTIDINPSDGESVVIDAVIPGVARISRGEASITYISLFYPFCLDASALEGY
ncbi:hypothetical protein ACFL2V_19490 [Pseudomonadota bacterium]